MRYFKKILNLITICMCFLFLTKQVNADFNTANSFPNCYSESYSNSIGSTPHNYFCKLYDSSGNIVYCLEIEKVVSGGTKHTFKDTVEGYGQACGVLKAMEDGLISTPSSDGTYSYKTVSSNDNFYEIQKKIWDYEGTTASCSTTLEPNISSSTTNLEVGSLSVSSNDIIMSIEKIDNVDYFVGTISLNLKNISNYTISNTNSDLIISTEKTGTAVNTSSDTTLYARIPISKVNSNTTYTISFSSKYDSSMTTTTTSTSTITPFIKRYFHATDRQLLGIIGLKRSTTTDSQTTTNTTPVNASIKLTATLPTPKLTLKKVDESGNLLNGATVKITKDGAEFQTVTLTNGTYSLESNLDYGKYCVTEVTAPTGYVKTDISSCVTLSKNNLNGEIIIKNKKTSVSFLKIDASTQKPLPGATLQILDVNNNVIVDENNQPKYSWVSTNQNYVIDGLPVGTYYLQEVAAPTGYSLNSEPIKFEVKADGSVVSEKQVGKDTTVIIMENKKTKTSFSKQDATTGKELPGATLQILDKDKKEIKDKDGNVLYKWVSTDKPYIIEGLPVGIYYLQETIQPKGYELSKEMVKFEVKSDGSITKVVMKNTPIIDVPDTALSKSVLYGIIGGILALLGTGLIIYVVLRKKNSKI